jgi:outer membrane receptor for ferrienterochelin and colicins
VKIGTFFLSILANYIDMYNIPNRHFLLFSFSRLQLLGIICLVILSFSTDLSAQSNVQLMGTVRDDENGEPLIGAEIVISGTPFQAFTDLEGSFRFENLPTGAYHLLISSLGYKTEQIENVIVYGDQTFRLNLSLSPLPIPGDSVYVEAYYPSINDMLNADQVILDSLDLANYKNLGVSQLLQQIPGIQIESTGGIDAGVFITIHGGEANQVLVLLDGQRLNNPQTGEIDLNLIPIENIEKIEISRAGNTAQFGANAFDGVINFRTRGIRLGKSAQIHSKLGSFSTATGGANARIGFSSLGVLLNYRQQYSKQDFWFAHRGQTTQRQNAWYKNYQVFGKTAANFERHNISLLYTYRRADQGLPSAFFEEMKHFNAFSEGQNQTVQLNHRSFIHRNFYIQTLIGFHYLNMLYNNEKDPSPFTRYKGRQINSVSELKIESVLQPLPSLFTRFGSQFLYEYLNGENLLYSDQSIGKKIRQSTAIYGSVEWSISQLQSIISDTQLRLALRYENALDAAEGIYPQIGLSMVPRYLTFLRLSAGWGKSVRYPDFNSLFWKGDALARGNPELSPERKIQRNFSADLNFPGSYLPSVNVYYFDEKITDLIFWHRTVQGAWEPRNENKVDKRGWDIQLTQKIYRDFSKISIAYSHIDAFNKSKEPNRYNKRIVFIPQHSLNTSFMLHFHFAQLIAVYRLVSERQTTAANTGLPLSSYQLFDFSVGYQIHINSLLLDLGLVMKNILGESYELIRGYPMPGREFHFSLSLKYQGY